LTVFQVERTHTLTIPTQGKARVLILNPEVLGIVSITDTEVVFQGLALGSTVVHLWDRSGRRDLRVDVMELKSVLSELERRKQEALSQRLGIPKRSLKLEYRGTQQHLERSQRVEFEDLSEDNRIRTHQLRTTMGLPFGNLLGDIYLEQRRDDDLGKEVTQPRHLALQLQQVEMGPLGKMDWVLGDKDLSLSHLTISGRRYRGVGLFPSEFLKESEKRWVLLSLFAGEEREGFFLDFPAGLQTRQDRSRFSGAKIETRWLEGLKTHLTGLHRFGPHGQDRADHVVEAGLDWQWQDWIALDAIGARNGTESGYELNAEFSPSDWIRFKNEFWRIGKRYKTVTGSVNRDGQTGWKGSIPITPPWWDNALSLKPEITIYRDRNALNPNNPKEWNTLYSLGTHLRLPLNTQLQADVGYEDQSGSPLPFVAQRYDVTLSREFLFQKETWLQDLFYGKEIVRGFTPFLGFRLADFGKSNNVPGFDATLKLLRVGTRLSFPMGLWGELSWSQGQLKESNPERDPQTLQPKELTLELGGSHRWNTPPIHLDANIRYVDVEDTFRKTHQPFSDQNRLMGTLRLSWRMAQDREWFGTLTATRQKPETVREDSVLDLFAQVGMRLAWDTGWAFMRKGRIVGSFFNDLNFNGIHDPNEPGLAGARVQVVQGPSTVTGPDGRFVIRSVSEGPQTVRLELDQVPKGYVLTTPNVTEVLVLPDREATVAFGIATQVEFAGRVYNDVNGNLAFEDGIDVPLSGILLTLETGQSDTTDATGYYRMARIPPGPHTVSVALATIPDGYRSSVPIRKSFTPHEGEVVIWDIPFNAIRGLLGSVFLDTDGDGLQDPHEPGVSGLKVKADAREVLTDPKGNFRLDDLPPGTLLIRLDPQALPKGYRLRSPEPIRLELPKGPFLHRIAIGLVPSDWVPPTIPSAEPIQPEASLEPTRPPDREPQILKRRIQTMLQRVAGSDFVIQIIDAELADLFPELSILAELHPGIRIDRSRSWDETVDLILSLIAQSVYHVDYYAARPSPRLNRFRLAAQSALMEVNVSQAANLQIILREICNRLGRSMQALDPSELARLDAWLGQIVSEERRAPGKR